MVVFLILNYHSHTDNQFISSGRICNANVASCNLLVTKFQLLFGGEGGCLDGKIVRV